ncbi:MAG TPA: M28 family metallopeptidase [Candidatus Acidoferrales bacterium]|nr:M28 family metallopeptidase [Candidatus Acidoferrales bacterium]
MNSTISTRRIALSFSLALFSVTVLALAASPKIHMLGFTPNSTARERSVEHQFLVLASPQHVRSFHRYLTAEPHPAGSVRNNALAQWLAQQWRAQGLEDVQIHEYDVLNSTPRSALVELLSPTHFRASLREDAYPQDPDTKNPAISGAYLGYSASGDVTASVVYAHSGNPEDYALLRQHGIDVRGKIVLVRYSNPYSYRGFKAYTAQKLGVAALLIYSDPAEDGYAKGKVFPNGPWGPASHIQRGSITYDFIEPGDPTTPGWASVPGAKHISPDKAVSMPHIIAVPLSWRDAEPILKNIGGPAAPKSWQGALPFTYHLGGSQARVHVKVAMNQKIEPYYDVEARITGSEHPNEWIILGNHRDAWVFGGVDPSSGTASMLELTRDLGALLRKGIRPKRTLVFGDWDGEEYALTGSTEWGEQYADKLKKNAIAYLNVDSSASGPDFDGSAVGSLAPLLVEVSRSLPAPSGKTLYDEWRASRARELNQKNVADSQLVETRIGSGSDHTVFLNYLGIPTMLLQFNGPYGVYHSAYDDFYWINHFGDPGYRYHTLMTQLWGALSLRLANSDILPYDFTFYAQQIRLYVRELDASSHLSAHMNLAPLNQAIDAFEKSARDLNAATAQALAAGKIAPAAADALNRSLMQVERNWCNPEGIPGRPWFKHDIYAARFTYAHLELPGITEAAESANWPLASAQAQILQKELQKNGDLLAAVSRKFAAANNLTQKVSQLPADKLR